MVLESHNCVKQASSTLCYCFCLSLVLSVVNVFFSLVLKQMAKFHCCWQDEKSFFLPFKFLDIYQKHHKNIVVRVVHYLFFTKHSNRRSQEFWNFLRLFIYLSQFILNISFGINRTIIRNCKMNCCNHCKVGRNQLFAETMLLYICMS